MPRIKTRQELPASAQVTVDLVERFGFRTWEFDYEYPVTPRGETLKRFQVRAEAHYAPSSEVQKLKEAMLRGEDLSPIVVTSDGYLVDGNTRMVAAQKANQTKIRALIIDHKAEGIKPKTERALTLLGAAANARHGKRLDRQEIRDAIEKISEDPDMDGSRIAELLGVSRGTVSQRLAEIRAVKRCEKLDLTLNGSLPVSSVAKLGHASDKLHDEPFKVLATLAKDAGLTGREIGELTKVAKDAPSDADAVTLLESARSERREQIEHYIASGKQRPSEASKLRRQLGFILGFEQNPQALIERGPEKAQHRDQVVRAVAVLQAVLEAQG